MYYELTDHFHVVAGMERCWDFFTQAENLPRITPPWLKFSLAMPHPRPAIEQDAVLDYTVRWAGVPVRWRTRIIDFAPPRQFIDLQTRGPYALWHHQHAFTSADRNAGREDDSASGELPNGGGGGGGDDNIRDGKGGVICFDRVIYRLPLGPIGRLTHAAVVRRQLLEIFRYRRRIIGQHLGWVRAIQPDVQIRRLP